MMFLNCFSLQVNAQIRQQCAALRAKGEISPHSVFVSPLLNALDHCTGYYGDGFWSSGRSLTYGGIDRPLDEAEQPMYIW